MGFLRGRRRRSSSSRGKGSCRCAYVIKEVVGVCKRAPPTQGPGIPERVKGQPASSSHSKEAAKARGLAGGGRGGSPHSAFRDPEQVSPGPRDRRGAGPKARGYLGQRKAEASGQQREGAPGQAFSQLAVPGGGLGRAASSAPPAPHRHFSGRPGSAGPSRCWCFKGQKGFSRP